MNLPGKHRSGFQIALLAFGTITFALWFAARADDLPDTVVGAPVSTNKYYNLKVCTYDVPARARRANGTNSVSIAYHKKELQTVYWAWMRVTNLEPCAILIWNARVQVPSKGKGTDGFGWETTYDDYPGPNIGTLDSGATGEVRVTISEEGPWRVCLLYSKEKDGKALAKDASSFTDSNETISPIFPDLDELEKKGK